MDALRLKHSRILIVDDQEENVLLLKATLREAGYVNVIGTTDPSRVDALCRESNFDLLLLDLHMPVRDGFDVMRELAQRDEGDWLPILVLTADDTQETRECALAAGARDFITKPLKRTEVLLRIKNLLEVRFLNHEVRARSTVLEHRVEERTEDLEQARLEMLERLALAAEYRDDDTGEHTRRVGSTSASIARAIGIDAESAELIRQAALLHDIGKIGVSDRILLKPGPLTPEERVLMQSHVTIGAAILAGSRHSLLQAAEQIAGTHHEWWDGSGYGKGLAGISIPVVGRIVAVADVFDALTHERPYKAAWPVDRAVAEIHTLSGRQFDPEMVEAFAALAHDELVTPRAAQPVAAGRELAA